MKIMSIEGFNKQVVYLSDKYKQHFNEPIPSQIIGWWNPLDIMVYPDEMTNGIKAMSHDVNKAIKDNIPIEPISDEMWDKIVF